MKPKSMSWLAGAVAASVAATTWAATTFTYQGQLKRGGVPLNDTCAIEFRLFNAVSLGSQVGAAQVVPALEIVNGLMQVDLDFGPGAFDGNRRWLEVAVQCTGDANATIMTPRQEINAAPHAVNADVLDGLDSTAFLRSVPNPLSLSGSQTSGHIIRGANTSATSGASGVLGQATATTGSTFGIWGSSSSSAGIGVLGQHLSNGGTTAGVVGESSSFAGGAAGVYGKVNGTVDVNYGVFGESPSVAGQGVYGKATSATGTTYGVHGESSSPSGAGVFGFAQFGDGVSARSDGENKNGVFAFTTNANGCGVYGKHTSPAGTRAGVQGETASISLRAKGVYGLATGISGGTYGVYGESASNAGQGVFGLVTSTSGITFGVQGETQSTTQGAAGVVGLATGDIGKTYGVFGQTDSDTGYSVYGIHAGSGRGVNGASSTGIGVYATTTSGSSALYAERTANGNRAWLGGQNEGAWAESTGGVALVGKTTNGVAALYGERIANGNKGWLGGINEGAWGEATVGNGVTGISSDAAGYGGYFRNDGGGAALFADGLAKVRTLEIIEGADLAEPFEVSAAKAAPCGAENELEGIDSAIVEAGLVLVIDPSEPGALKVSTEPYDRKVAGVISGANGLAPGLVMKGKARGLTGGGHPVALSGRVWCWCDASTGPISPGDMLTTSSVTGHAMKAIDLGAAQGAIIGKAMTPLENGRGLVLILVNLQ